MFDKNSFSNILKEISNTYNSISEFSEKSCVNRTYLSKYINKKLESPPTPKVLMKISNASNNIVSYDKLMQICGYVYLEEITINSYGITDEYWRMIFGNHDKIKLSVKGSTFLASLLDELNKYVNEAHNNNETLVNLNLDPNRLIPFTKDVYEFVEYRKIFSFIVCVLLDSLKITDEHKQNILNSTKELIENLPTTQDYNNFESTTTFPKDRPVKEKNLNKFYMTPVYGRISAGQPNWAEECIEGRIPIDPEMMNITNPEECFFLKVNGESMNKEIKNGAYALIRKTDFVENGDIAVVLVNGFDATLKKFSKQGDLIILEPLSNDPSFNTQVYNKDTEIKVIGKYIGKMEMK